MVGDEGRGALTSGVSRDPAAYDQSLLPTGHDYPHVAAPHAEKWLGQAMAGTAAHSTLG